MSSVIVKYNQTFNLTESVTCSQYYNVCNNKIQSLSVVCSGVIESFKIRYYPTLPGIPENYPTYKSDLRRLHQHK